LVNTRVGSEASARSSANSFCDRSTGAPRRRTTRAAESTSRLTRRAPAQLGAAQERRQAGAQLRITEGLAQVVVASALEAAQAIELGIAAAEHEHRHGRIDAAGDAVGRAGQAHEVQARAVRQAEVDDRGIGELRLQQPQAVAHRLGDEQLVAVGREVVGQERPRRLVVLDDEDGGGGIGEAHGATRSAPRETRPRWRLVTSLTRAAG
jgi:hypothetical protein